MAPTSALTRFWRTDLARDGVLELLEREDLENLRLVCRDLSAPVARMLFSDLRITFRNSTFIKPARMAALKRIGGHVRTLTFVMPHTQETFLPPLLDPITGEELTFVYFPQIREPDVSSRQNEPKYGSWEMNELLVKQYPTLFHAATNVPSFVQALSCMPSLRSLKIACSGQAATHRYRRSVVDYALISLRIAVERAPLRSLESLCLQPIHPGGIHYLRPIMGFGTSPASCKRWSLIRNLVLHIDSFPTEQGQSMDQLKILHSYLQCFPNLQNLDFCWNGAKGPFPLSLSSEPALCTPSPRTVCPARYNWPLRALKLRNLRYMSLRNVIVDASQVASFTTEHRHSLEEFDFEDTVLRSGTWDDALAPLTRMSDKEHGVRVEEAEVPIMLSPEEPPMYFKPTILSPTPATHHRRRRTRKRRHREHAGDRSQSKAKAREVHWLSPEHLKRFIQSSVLFSSWR